MCGSSSPPTRCSYPARATSTTRSGAHDMLGPPRVAVFPLVLPAQQTLRRWHQGRGRASWAVGGGPASGCTTLRPSTLQAAAAALLCAACRCGIQCAARLPARPPAPDAPPPSAPPGAATGLSTCWRRASPTGCGSRARTRSRSASTCTAAGTRDTRTLRTTTPAVRGPG